jgi:hypothetical protein
LRVDVGAVPVLAKPLRTLEPLEVIGVKAHNNVPQQDRRSNMVLSRKAAAIWASAVMALGVAVPAVAVAGDYCPPKPPPEKQRCDAGRGNGSEGCDPGNSSTNDNGTTGQNQGGDEGGPIRGGTGAP